METVLYPKRGKKRRLTGWLDKSGLLIPAGTPRVTGGKGSTNKDLIRKGPGAFGSVWICCLEPGMNINSLSLLEKTAQVTPQVMRMLDELLKREVTRDDPEWTAANSQ